MPDDSKPFALVVRFTVRPGSEEAFDRLTKETASGVRGHEYNTLIYACHTVEGQPRQRIFYELYRNQAAFEQHEAREHIRQFLDQRAELLESTEVDVLALRDGKTPPGFQVDAIVAGARSRIRSGHERARMLRVILVALDNVDAVKELVETTDSPETAQAALMDLLDIDEIQAMMVLDIQLRSLSPKRRQLINAELDAVLAEEADLEAILASAGRLRELVGTERGANLAKYDERGWARSGDDE